MMKKLTMGCAGIAVLTFTGVTQADSVRLEFNGVQSYQNTDYDYVDGARHADFDGNTIAGKFAWTVVTGGTYGTAIFNQGDTFFTFCTELTQNIQNGVEYDYDLVGPSQVPDPGQGFTMGSFRASLVAEFFDKFFVTASTGTDTQAAAFQMGVWEIVYQDDTATAKGGDGTFDSLGEIDLNTLRGVFFMSNGVAGGQANDWLDMLSGSYPVDPDWLVGFKSTSFQDQITTMVPLPAPVWMAAVGLLGVVVGRRTLGRVAV